MKNNIGAMMKQAQMMQQRMQDMQNQLERVEITGSSGGGLVHVTMTGKGIIRHVK
ncbi:MAG TPA: YbaB/EbfC family nucleoid-associated protein, partial [Alphaproteobacteria bacterium]|nr:YbaB/EbfC family nucleoid-associated protein [Alphaproteobacteria bacterium]